MPFKTLLDGLVYSLILLVMIVLLGGGAHTFYQKETFNLVLNHTYWAIFGQWALVIFLNALIFSFMKKKYYSQRSVFLQTLLLGVICAACLLTVLNIGFASQLLKAEDIMWFIINLMAGRNTMKALLMIALIFLVVYPVVFTLVKIVMDRILWNKALHKQHNTNSSVS
jgi:hypothetical protein